MSGVEFDQGVSDASDRGRTSAIEFDDAGAPAPEVVA
jgi:hypothetical protein